MIQQVIFYLFAALLIFSGVRVVASRNPVHSALFLVLAFVAAAPLWIMAGAEFLGLVLVFVYVGAVMTLFLFVVMMLNLDEVPRSKGFVRYLPFGLIIVGLIVTLMLNVIDPSHFSLHVNAGMIVPQHHSNTKELGLMLFTQYLLPFELAGALLIVAIISAIGLAFRGPRARKVQDPSAQIAVKRNERVRLVNMEAEKKS